MATTLRHRGLEVAWCSEGRSPATRARAGAAGLTDVGTLTELCRTVEVIFSVCPPASARTVAAGVAAAGYRGTFVDANAVAPATARDVGSIVEAAGAGMVDGGIVGPPAERPGTTRLYLSGPRADDVAALFAAGPLEARVVPGSVGAASLLKACYAGYTKGTAALLLAVVALAEAGEVGEALREEWELSQPGLTDRVLAAARNSGPKAWRWIGEMAEIATTMEDEGLPSGFHTAAAEVFERLGALKDLADVDPAEVVALIGGGDGVPVGPAGPVRPPAAPG